MRIGIDIDGVILDYERMMRFYAAYYDVLIGGNGKINDDFSYLNMYDWNKWEKEDFISNYLILGTNNCGLVPGSKEVIDLLHKNGIEIVFITARGSINKKTKEEVLKTLKKYDIYYDNIYFEVTDKLRICKELGIDLMIDDHPQICNSLKNGKVRTIYFKDCDVQIKENNYLVMINDWGELLRYLVKNKIINIT